MKLVCSNPWRENAVSRVFGALFYSTQASPPPPTSVFVPQDFAARKRKPWGFYSPSPQSVLYSHALHVSTWMSDELKLDLTPGDIAARIDLISKVHGPEEAHKYFHGVTDPGLQAYSTLLHCYAQHKLSDKAESVFQKMKELGFVMRIGSYNKMLGVYFKNGEC
ncbi:hypothetical protein M0R45_009543 [Rubus argutus]|uniref:Pentatricopeptide repeat-containing protein n=1 Tax=Rubus argutus TaxID=59490 RepID=A0AAW1Y4R9_RUBAR